MCFLCFTAVLCHFCAWKISPWISFHPVCVTVRELLVLNLFLLRLRHPGQKPKNRLYVCHKRKIYEARLHPTNISCRSLIMWLFCRLKDIWTKWGQYASFTYLSTLPDISTHLKFLPLRISAKAITAAFCSTVTHWVFGCRMIVFTLSVKFLITGENEKTRASESRTFGIKTVI